MRAAASRRLRSSGVISSSSRAALAQGSCWSHLV